MGADAILHTSSGSHGLRLHVAASFASRLRGLIGAAPLAMGEGMLITRCRAVHTCLMRQCLDLVYLDRHGRVLHCVRGLAPWRMHAAARAVHVLELAAGSIARYHIAPGDQLQHPVLTSRPLRKHQERGAAMAEFLIVAPVLTMLGLGVLQASLMYFAKSQVNHAAFLAARAGSMHHASLESIRDAYLRGLAPLYGGGTDAARIAASRDRAAADMQGNFRIELLNPVRASFDDFHDAVLQARMKITARVIPNAGLAFRDPERIGAASGQNLFDANLLRLRFTHGYEPKVPLVKTLLRKVMQAQDAAAGNTDAFIRKLHDDGRIALVSDITLHMHSDAIEWSDSTWTSPSASAGGESGAPPADANDGSAQHPGGNAGGAPGADGGVNPANPPDEPGCSAPSCLSCRADAPLTQQYPLAADVLFDFDQATLRADGLADLDALIEEVRAAQRDGQGIASVQIYGYTDQLGSDALNQRLSLARAQAVRDYMKSRGFPDVPISVRGMGAADPKIPLGACAQQGQEQIECLAPNRRVVVEISRVENAR
jgi:outer membrane protein OmpA-like peptidoglycan-associated protein/uncharacterized membrane protein (UPF0127 family)